MAKKSVKKIADFGEKIEGAKKDLWRARGGLTVADYNSLTDGEKKKYLRRDEIWQKPDLLTKIQSGEISRTAGWIQNQLRTKISPVCRYGDAENYIDTIIAVRDMAEKVVDEPSWNICSMDLYNRFTTGKGYFRCVEKTAHGALQSAFFRIVQTKWHWAEGKAVREGYGLTKDEKRDAAFGKKYKIYQCDMGKDLYSPEKECLQHEISYGTYWFYNFPEEAARHGTWFIVNDSNFVSGGYASETEAKEAFLKLREEVYAAEAAKPSGNRKQRFRPVVVEHIVRTGGPDYLSELHPYFTMNVDKNGQYTMQFEMADGDSHAHGEDFLKVFGFRGGQFGNWLNEDDKQASLDYGYDATKDLSFVMDVTDQSLSLNGTLGIAWGARGFGNTYAHYDPTYRVINLNKLNGGGAYAHEYGHALDHYVGEVYGCKGYAIDSAVRQGNGLPEAYHELYREMFSLNVPDGYYEQSIKFGQMFAKSGHGYWSSAVEMFARAFDCWVSDKLTDAGIKSQYLTAYSDSFYAYDKDGETVYAYPRGEQRKCLDALFDKLMQELKEDGVLNGRSL